MININSVAAKTIDVLMKHDNETIIMLNKDLKKNIHLKQYIESIEINENNLKHLSGMINENILQQMMLMHHIIVQYQ
jgi:hypothetical protein